MSPIELQQLHVSMGKGLANFLKHKEPTLYRQIKEGSGRSYSENLFLMMGYTKIQCKCGQTSRFISIKEGYAPFCSKKCSDLEQGLRIKDAIRQGKYESVGDKSKQTFLKRGGSYQESAAKRLNTLLEKYGVSHPTQMPGHTEKVKRNNVDKYGSEKNKKRSDNMKRRCEEGSVGTLGEAYKNYLKDLGVSNVSQLEHIKEQKRNTKLLRAAKLLFENKFSNIKPNFNLKDYVGTKQTYSFICLQCNTEFESTLQNGTIPRCYTCNPRQYHRTSSAQKEIYEIVKEYYPLATLNDRSVLINNLELDIYIPEIRVAIEYNGLYWHSEVGGGKSRDYHINKTEECNKLGIRLIQVFEDEWVNSRQLTINKIKHILHISNGERIYARQCIIKEVSSKEKSLFLNTYHIQGDDRSSIKLGAYFNSRLVALMTFGSLRKSLGSKAKVDEYELYRFCTIDQPVVGIASKLQKHFIKNYNPTKIISYADRRWSLGNLYNNIGYKLVGYTPPNYWYLKNDRRYHRYNFRKNTLSKKLEHYNPQLTEWQNMQYNKYDRIWDCGSIKFEWKF